MASQKSKSRALEIAAQSLDEAQKKHEIDSCTFYIRDSWWADEFRLVLMPGVNHKEPMHGFLSHDNLKGLVVQRPYSEKFFKNARTSLELRERMSNQLSILVRGNKLFGDFIEREKVVSCARFVHFSKDNVPVSILFFNFKKHVDFLGMKADMRALAKKLFLMVPEIQRLQRNSFPNQELLRILHPITKLASMGIHTANDSQIKSANESDFVAKEHRSDELRNLFRDILEAALRAFGLDHSTSLGTIHLRDSNTGALNIAGTYGHLDLLERKYNVSKGEGVISWVLHRRRSVIIDDIGKSEFSDIYVKVRNGVKSELAVPMLAGAELIGVLNLESLKVSAFSPEQVRVLSYAANQAAIAWRLSQQIERSQGLAELNERLFEISIAVAKGEQSWKALNELGDLACQALGAATCDIAPYDPSMEGWSSSGGSLEAALMPRSNGWTRYIGKLKRPVWISNIENDTNFDVQWWDSDSKEWLSTFNAGGIKMQDRPSLNSRTVILGAKAELGLPINSLDECVGVAWLKYLSPGATAPLARSMATATGFAGQTGLILDLLKHRGRQGEETKEKREIQDLYESITERGRIPFQGLDCYIATQSFTPSAGGDFVSTVKLDEKTLGILIADAKGHGFRAAVYMLPLLATFKTHHLSSRSTKYMLERLNKVANELRVTGTAIYFLISRVQNDRFLFASSAAHEPLIVWKDPRNIIAFPETSSAAQATLLGLDSQLTIGEDSYKVSHDDIIVGYTDGISEALNESGESFGRSQIVNIIEKFRDRTAEQIANAIMAEAGVHARGALQDDASVVVIRMNKIDFADTDAHFSGGPD